MTNQELIDLIATWRDDLRAEQEARSGAIAARIGDFADVCRNYASAIARACEEAGQEVSLAAFDEAAPTDEAAP